MSYKPTYPLNDRGGSYIAMLAEQRIRGRESPFMEVDSFLERTTTGAAGTVTKLAHGPIVPENLTLKAPDGSTYIEGTDYAVDSASGTFTNLAIPSGTEVKADYFYYGEGSTEPTLEPPGEGAVAPPEAPESGSGPWWPLPLENGWMGSPMARVEGESIRLKGRITAGTTTVNTHVLTLPPGMAPDDEAWLPTLSDGGPALLVIQETGVGRIGDSPFEVSGWLTLDGLTFPAGEPESLPPFESWSQSDIFFGDAELDVSFAELA